MTKIPNGGASPALSQKCTCQIAAAAAPPPNGKDQMSVDTKQFEDSAVAVPAATQNGHSAASFGGESSSLAPSTQHVDKTVAAMLFNKLG